MQVPRHAVILKSLITLFILMSPMAFAGGIQGTLTDPKGYTLAGVSVNLYNAEGSLVWSKVTSPYGNYVLDGVPEGSYDLSLVGLSCTYRQKIVIQVGAIANLDIVAPCTNIPTYAPVVPGVYEYHQPTIYIYERPFRDPWLDRNYDGHHERHERGRDHR